MMAAGRARGEDLPALRRLFMTCFGDPEAYCNLYFLHSFHPGRVFVLREGSRVVAMTISFPVSYIAPDGEEQQGAYLYAVATDPDYRGRGLCRMLLQFAENSLKGEGLDFTCLKPSSDKLAGMYEKFGYRLSFTLRELSVTAAPVMDVRITPIREDRYFLLRELLLRESFLSWQEEALAHQRRLCLWQGGALLEVASGDKIGCAACEFDGKSLLMKEFLGDEDWLPAVLEHFGVSQAYGRLPGDETPFAMAKTLSGKTLPGGWLGFAFD